MEENNYLSSTICSMVPINDSWVSTCSGVNVGFSEPDLTCDYCGRKGNWNFRRIQSNTNNNNYRLICPDCEMELMDKILGKERVMASRI